MRSLLLLLASSADVQFHQWCDLVGIETPTAKLLTTPDSVAGRGVFATDDVKEGDVLITIPDKLVLHQYTAGQVFPDLENEIRSQKKQLKRGNRWWRRLLGMRGKKYEFTDESDLWQAELTKYSLACIEENNFWAPWICQWQRTDPMQRLFASDASLDDEDVISACVDELEQVMLPNREKLLIRGAVEIRLRRYKELCDIYDLDGPCASSMFGLLTSRAIDIDTGLVGVIPMFDMINHSPNPNMELSFDDDAETIELKARRDIEKGEELFICYTDEADSDDEYSSMWTAVQWGIPQFDSKNTAGKEKNTIDV